MNKVCLKCRGRKIITGIGGIERTCPTCEGKGHIEQKTDTEITLDSPQKKQNETAKFNQDVLPTVIPTEIPAKTAAILPEPINNTVTDPVLAAALDEPKMSTVDWQTKYPAVAASTSIKQRHEMRATYASAMPMAPRTIDLQKLQDQVAESDTQYLSYQANEKRRNDAKKGKGA